MVVSHRGKLARYWPKKAQACWCFQYHGHQLRHPLAMKGWMELWHW